MGACSSVSKAYAISPYRKKKPLVKEEQNPVQMVDSWCNLKNSELGSKDESFFDSKAWLDSDCDDDFFSVNGDFTPSRGTTPNNQIRGISKSVISSTFSFDQFADNKSEPSPIGRKKLSDLFEEQETKVRQPSTDSSEKLEINGTRTVVPDEQVKNRKKRAAKAAQCCLPSFGVYSQKMSPVQ